MDQQVTLSCQGQKIQVRLAIIQKSSIIKNMIEDMGMEDEIEIPKTKVEILTKVVDFLTYYETRQFGKIQKPLRSANLLEHGVSQWDFEYISGL